MGASSPRSSPPTLRDGPGGNDRAARHRPSPRRRRAPAGAGRGGGVAGGSAGSHTRRMRSTPRRTSTQYSLRPPSRSGSSGAPLACQEGSHGLGYRPCDAPRTRSSRPHRARGASGAASSGVGRAWRAQGSPAIPNAVQGVRGRGSQGAGGEAARWLGVCLGYPWWRQHRCHDPGLPWRGLGRLLVDIDRVGGAVPSVDVDHRLWAP